MKKLFTIGALIVATLFLIGCGTKTKEIDELKKDLLSSKEFKIEDGSEVVDFAIIKRLTEAEQRKDTVYVSLKIGSEFYYKTMAYSMHYTEYNDGWLLDTIEPYYGNDFEYKTVLIGKYENCLNKSIYEYREDGTFREEMSTANPGEYLIYEGTYAIDENNYNYVEGYTDGLSHGLGHVYKDYMCNVYAGQMPNGSNKVTLTDVSDDSFELLFDGNTVQSIWNMQQTEVFWEGTFHRDKNMIECNLTTGDTIKMFIDGDVLYQVYAYKIE